MDPYRITPKNTPDLMKYDAGDTSFFEGGKKEGLLELAKLNKKLDALQELLYAQHEHRVLVILQAMDTGGKDGVVRSVFEGVNPQGVRVVSFKVPSAEEIDHDYLWRVHKQAPGKGEIVIFNRSHYEDVLVVRVHELVPPKTWKKRYRHIREFERMLADEGVTILKFFLHISPEEQKERLLERISDPAKQWKFNPGDLSERARWNDYMRAYQDVLAETSTPWAPWYAIPADRNWYRNLMVSSTLVRTLEKMKMHYPAPVAEIEQYAAQLASEAEQAQA
jgi:PPK2 family polyphosphate:nucleotide phosphotransferase